MKKIIAILTLSLAGLLFVISDCSAVDHVFRWRPPTPAIDAGAATWYEICYADTLGGLFERKQCVNVGNTIIDGRVIGGLNNFQYNVGSYFAIKTCNEYGESEHLTNILYIVTATSNVKTVYAYTHEEDFDGDGWRDVSYVSSDGKTYIDYAGNGFGAWDIILNGYWDINPLKVFEFGIATDIPYPGDWDGNGTKDFGIVRKNTATGKWNFIIDSNNNRVLDDEEESSAIVFGDALSDIPVPAGDWNGDGRDSVAIARASSIYPTKRKFIFDYNGSGAWEEATDKTADPFGLLADTISPSGDWNGDGKDGMAIARISSVYPGKWSHFIDYNDNRVWEVGESIDPFGVSTDIVLGGGDWNSDGKDSITVARKNTITGKWEGYADYNDNRVWDNGIDLKIETPYNISSHTPLLLESNEIPVIKATYIEGGKLIWDLR